MKDADFVPCGLPDLQEPSVDYCSACAYDPRRKHGEGACPFNSLYWDFYARHRKKLSANPRIGMMLRTWDRMAAPEKRRILKQAETYLGKIDRL